MVTLRASQCVLAALCLAKLAVSSLPPIVTKGQYFFYSHNGTQFYIRGIAYQQGINVDGTSANPDTSSYLDPLSDAASCKRDIPYLQKLGTNTIRVYAVNPDKNHDECMTALDAAGIYVIADLGEPKQSIVSASPEWNTDLYTRYTAVIDSLAQYPNVIGFFAGNEVVSNTSYTAAAAFVKAAVRDTKAYIASRNYTHWLGVGYANNDDPDTRDNLAAYFACGADAAERVDFWGYNIYEWCGASTFADSGYAARTKEFANYPVPAFFAEYGCNTNPPGADNRLFQETGALYSSQMNKVWSGGIVYQYFQEENDYGLVNTTSTTVTELKSFPRLASAIASAGYPTGTSLASYNPTNTPPSCPPTSNSPSWIPSPSPPLPPTPNTTLCACQYSSLTCVPTSNVLANATAVGLLFATVCGLDSGSACRDIRADVQKGVYGSLSACTGVQKLGFAVNQYYLDQKEAKGACDFGGQAVTRTVGAVESSCVAAIASGTGGGSGSGGDKKDSGGGRTVDVRGLAVGGYVVAAMGVGAGAVLLW
ncbi:Glucanosyltransferase-domain-containing protein [Cercophora scortea]|uniref:1,3-beta-glucanosyltransferase n=1 Tax=Cercophora scortea TaxID=314031 RepID=A0AAE0IXG0_9PEZI|nr:Glucanosyltransferase-domain-containing protein [Cercophora scortea]